MNNVNKKQIYILIALYMVGYALERFYIQNITGIDIFTRFGIAIYLPMSYFVFILKDNEPTIKSLGFFGLYFGVNLIRNIFLLIQGEERLVIGIYTICVVITLFIIYKEISRLKKA